MPQTVPLTAFNVITRTIRLSPTREQRKTLRLRCFEWVKGRLRWPTLGSTAVLARAGTPTVDAVYDRMRGCHRNFPWRCCSFGPAPRELERQFGPRARPACGHRPHRQRSNREVTFPLASQSCHGAHEFPPNRGVWGQVATNLMAEGLTDENPIHPLKNSEEPLGSLIFLG